MVFKKILLVLGLAGFTVMADNWVISPILPAIAGDLNQDIARAGLLITAYMIPFGLFQLIFGPLADRYGKRQVINLSMLFFSVAAALCAISVGFSDLMIYRALTGIFAASVMPVSLALIGDIVPMPNRQSAIGSFMGISFLGQGLSMGIGGSIAYFLNWRGVFAVYAVLAVISTFLLFTTGKKIPSKKNPEAKFFAPYAKLLGNGYSLRTYLVVLLEGILIIGSFSYLGSFIQKTFHLNYLNIGLIMTGFGLAAIVGGRLSGKLAQKWGRRSTLLMGLFSAVLADVLIAILGSNLTVVIIGVTLLGLGFIFAHSTLLTIATEFAEQARGAAMSLVAFCFMGGGGLGTALGGKIIAAQGFASFYGYYAVALVALFFLALVLVEVNKPVPVMQK